MAETQVQELANRDPRAAQLIRNDEFFAGNASYTPVGGDDAYVTQFCPTGYQSIKGYNPATLIRDIM